MDKKMIEIENSAIQIIKEFEMANTALSSTWEKGLYNKLESNYLYSNRKMNSPIYLCGTLLLLNIGVVLFSMYFSSDNLVNRSEDLKSLKEELLISNI
jgi:hypothetical protein